MVLCALQGTCGGRCLPCTSQEGKYISGVWVHPSCTEHTPYGLVRSPGAPMGFTPVILTVRTDGFTPVMGCAQIDHTPVWSCALSEEAPAVGVACLAPVKREITFPLFLSPRFTPVTGIEPHSVWSCALSGVWVHPGYGVRTDRVHPHSVWSCALSEGTCGGRCLPCTSQEGNNLSLLTDNTCISGVWVHPSYGVRTDRPHSVWSCALSEGTCGGRCLPCTSQEGNNLSPLD